MEKPGKLTNLQLELLKIFSLNLNEDQLIEIKNILSNYFAEKASDETDKLWEKNNWNNDLMDEWSKEHLSTLMFQKK